MKIHPSLTLELIMHAVESDDYIGFCLKCGAEHYGVEPDAVGYECEECEAHAVSGAEDIFISYDNLLK
jgi:hypothetical protein